MRKFFRTFCLSLSIGALQSLATPPVIVLDPQPQAGVPGSSVTFEARAEGSPPLLLQWRAYQGSTFTNVAGANDQLLTLTNIQSTTRKFALYAANSEGSVTSQLASLTVLRPPTISTHPSSVIAVDGGTVFLQAAALGVPPISYQWLANEQVLPDQTNQTMVLTGVSALSEADYTLVASNSSGASTSRVARVRVTPPPSTLEARVFAKASPLAMAYRLHTPPASANPTPASYPLVLALHGSGAEGNDNLRQLSPWFQPMVFISHTNQSRFPLVFVAPQCPGGRDWSDPAVQAQLFALIDALAAEFPVDTNRLYVTGLSMGGHATWALPLVRKSYFAASIPIAGWGDSNRAAEYGDLPIWAFHSDVDPIISVSSSIEMVDAIRKAGGHPIFTDYASGGHEIWAQAWATPGLVEWLMSQRRGEVSSTAPDLQITQPIREGGLAFSTSTNLLISGTARLLGQPLSSVAWHTLRPVRTGKGTGSNQWSATNLPLTLGKTNRVLVLGSTISFAPALGGTTTVNDVIDVVSLSPVTLSTTHAAGVLHIEWTGGPGPYRLQTTTDLEHEAWVDLVSPAVSPEDQALEGPLRFFRILSGPGAP